MNSSQQQQLIIKRMTSSLLSSANPVNVNSDRSSTRRRKKKKIQIQAQDNQQQQQQNEWKSEMQQQIYSSKLLQALRQVRGANSKRVHEAADKVLATAAKGRTRWSRAILRNRVKLKFMKRKSMVKRQREVMRRVISSSSGKKSNSKVKILRLKSKSLPAVQRKVRVLGRLVPGCRKQPMPVVLEEATDYIAALEMQVRAMSALAELLSVSGSGSGSGSGPSTAQGHASTSSN